MKLPTFSEPCDRCEPKTATWCKGCPAEAGCHYVVPTATGPAQVLVLMEPMVPYVEGTFSRDTYNNHIPQSDNAGRIVTAALKALYVSRPELSSVEVAIAYAARCASDEFPRDVYDRCRNYLTETVHAVSSAANKPLVVLAMGAESVKTLGIKTKKLADVQSRVMTGVEFDGKNITVVPTISPAQLVAAAGYFNVFQRDLVRALELGIVTEYVHKPLDELTRGYIIPRTLDEVRALVDMVTKYAAPGFTAETSPIAIDTETNTRFPHRANTKMLVLSFAWDRGKAAAVTLWHKNAPYDPEEAASLLRPLVEGSRPKVLHNAKFDLKVFRHYGWELGNFTWDTMLAEHSLEEDKKGQYGLKQLTRVIAPDFAAYADELHALQERLEGSTQLDNLRKSMAVPDATTTVEPELGGNATKKSKKPKAKSKKAEDGGFEDVDLGTLLKYAAVDADMTWRLAGTQATRFGKEEQSYRKKCGLYDKIVKPVPTTGNRPAQKAYKDITLAAVTELTDMEYRGIRVDVPYLGRLDDALGEIIHKTQGELLQIAGSAELNLNSAAQIANLLFNVGYVDPETSKRIIHTPVSHTDGGQAQTTDKVMKALVAKAGCRFAAKKLIYAKAYKAKNTFVANVRDLSSLDGYLHTNYNQHGTATYRLSSSDENMQNVPKKLAGYSIKKIFIPDDDSYLFVNADAKGAEVRIFTAYSRDAALIKSLNDGFDTHCFIATEIVKAVRKDPSLAAEVLQAIGLDDQYPLTYEDFASRDRLKQSAPNYGEMLDKFRTAVKRVVFGILYGAAAPKIAETIGISEEQARQIIDLLFTLYPSIPEYMRRTKLELNYFGLVETYFGRRRRFSVAGAPGYMRSRAGRQAVNFKIQSTSSDIVLTCLRNLAAPLRSDMGGRLLLTVHDSLGFQCLKKYASQLPEFIEEHLVQRTAKLFPWLPVAFTWDFEVGPSYGELQPLDTWLEKQQPSVSTTNELYEAYDDDDVYSDLRDEATQPASVRPDERSPDRG